MTTPIVVTRLGKGAELTYAEVDANFTNLRDAFGTIYPGISGDISVTSGGTASINAGVVVNADINASAAIAHSKLAAIPAGQVLLGNGASVPTATALSGDIVVSSTGVVQLTAGAVVDDHVDAAAAIAHSKLASMSAGHVLLGNVSNVPTATAISGDLTINGSGVASIAAGAVVDADVNAGAAISHSKLASMTPGQVLLGNGSSVPTATSISGDLTINGSGQALITAGAITNTEVSAAAFIAHSKLADMAPGQVLLGNPGSVPTATTITGDITIDAAGVATLSAGSIGIGAMGALPAGQLIIGNAANEATATTITGDLTVDSSGVALIAPGAITNTEVSAAAFIAHSKLANMSPGQVLLGNSGSVPTATTVSGDITINSSGQALITAGAITNAEVSGAAFIAHSKLADMSPGRVLLGNSSSVPTATAISGDITISSSGVATIASGSVTADKLSTIPDSKLATILTAGKVSNSATTATALNTANAIVARDSSGSIATSSINGGPLGGYRNAVINGNFDIWTRGTSFTGANAIANGYVADRWRLGSDAPAREVLRTSFALGQTSVPGEPTYGIRIIQSTAGSGATFSGLNQRIEGVRTFAGQKVTLTFYAKAASNKTLPNVRVLQRFGSGGAPSPNNAANFATNVAITTSWQRYSYTITVPSISGKTIGTAGNDNLDLSFNLPLNQTYDIEFACIQLEPGTEATPFELRPLAAELALCQRYFHGPYYPRSYIGTATGLANIMITFPVPMRDVPIVQYSTLGPGSNFGFNGTNNSISIVGEVGGTSGNYRIGIDDLYFDAEL